MAGTEPLSDPLRNCVVNLALQGGGSHGAFTWGVLDKLLEDGRLSFDGITATSAGAINAVLVADGWASGGREGARALLRRFWRRTSEMASSSFFAPSLADRMNPGCGLDHSPGYIFVDMISRFLSPYQLNPWDLNPARDLLEEVVDFDRVRKQKDIKLFLAATNIQSGKIKIFTREEITVNHVLASACLPFLMRAPEIDGEAYWDGALIGNPAIFPVIYNCNSQDVIMVQLTPAQRKELPTTARTILNRLQEISFNSSFMREMRAVAFITRLIDEGKLDNGKRIYMHLIEAQDVISKYSGSSKMNANWNFLTSLFETGRERAGKWLTDHFDSVGRQSTIDMETNYL